MWVEYLCRDFGSPSKNAEDQSPKIDNHRQGSRARRRRCGTRCSPGATRSLCRRRDTFAPRLLSSTVRRTGSSVQPTCCHPTGPCLVSMDPRVPRHHNQVGRKGSKAGYPDGLSRITNSVRSLPTRETQRQYPLPPPLAGTSASQRSFAGRDKAVLGSMDIISAQRAPTP